MDIYTLNRYKFSVINNWLKKDYLNCTVFKIY